MKLIIAHLPTDVFEPVRMHLGDLGVLRLTISEVHVASGQSTITLRYRGSTLETHLEAGLRLECVATDGQAPGVINVLRGHAGSAGQVAMLDLEELHQQSSEDDFSQEALPDMAVQ